MIYIGISFLVSIIGKKKNKKKKTRKKQNKTKQNKKPTSVSFWAIISAANFYNNFKMMHCRKEKTADFCLLKSSHSALNSLIFNSWFWRSTIIVEDCFWHETHGLPGMGLGCSRKQRTPPDDKHIFLKSKILEFHDLNFVYKIGNSHFLYPKRINNLWIPIFVPKTIKIFGNSHVFLTCATKKVNILGGIPNGNCG